MIEEGGMSGGALKALLGDYPNTRALKSGQVSSERVQFDFADEKTVNKAFKRVVREVEFDVAELAIATFLQAKAHGKPLVLLPAVVRGKFAHSTLAYNTERGELKPADLPGRRVGIRAYAQTTPLWVRGILQNEYGVDLDRVKWVTFEDPHVAEYREPATAQRAAAGKKAREMLLEGELDAAILSEQRDAGEARLKPLIPDAPAAAQAWYRKHGVVPINHMVVVKQSLSKSDPEAVAEIFRLLSESKKAAGLPKAGEIDGFTLGIEACRKGLEMAIRFAEQQRLLPRRLTVDELFDDTTRRLGR
jgi:4,5-dihydroxyphthalate decarboxylase